jgi:hypothetical protein
MSKMTFTCAAIAVVATTTSAYLWTELRNERNRINAPHQHGKQTGRRIDATSFGSARTTQLSPSLHGALAPHLSVNTMGDAVGGAAGRTAGGAFTAVMSAADGTQVNLDSQQLMQDPDYREGLATKLHFSLAQNYPNLAKELGLTPEQARNMLGILAKYQISSMSRSQPESVDDNSWREQEAEIAALIGDAKNQEWKEYQASMPARQRVNELGVELEFVGLPLTEQQRQQLVGTIAAEQKRQSEDSQFTTPSSNPDALRNPAAFFEQSQRETNRRFLESASLYLNQSQIESLRITQNKEMAMTLAMIRAGQAKSGG